MVPTSDAERDSQLARLIDELLEAARQGQTPPFDEVARQYPHLAVELRELWATAQLAEQ